MKKTIQNFHCGYFADSDELDAILHFRRDTIEDYFEWSRQYTPALQKTLAAILRKPIKRQMLDQSEPYRALRTGDAALIERFFGKETPPVSSSTPTVPK